MAELRQFTKLATGSSILLDGSIYLPDGLYSCREGGKSWLMRIQNHAYGSIALAFRTCIDANSLSPYLRLT
jgi:hypothetical protein